MSTAPNKNMCTHINVKNIGERQPEGNTQRDEKEQRTNEKLTYGAIHKLTVNVRFRRATKYKEKKVTEVNP